MVSMQHYTAPPIRVTTNDGSKEIRADYRGSTFAVHRTVGDDKHWTITHLPSGRAVGRRYSNQSAATRVLLALEDQKDRWQFSRMEDATDEHRALLKAARKKARA